MKPAPSESELQWVVDASVAYQSTTIHSEDVVPIYLDTGSGTISLTPDAYDKFLEATGAEPHRDVTKISREKYAKMGDLNIVMAGQTFPLIPNALKNWYISRQGSPDSKASDNGASDSGAPENKTPGNGTTSASDEYITLRVDKFSKEGFIIGSPFFERYYVHLDADNEQVGIGITEYTRSLVN